MKRRKINRAVLFVRKACFFVCMLALSLTTVWAAEAVSGAETSPVFLFLSGETHGDCQDVFTFFSAVEINGNVSGHIYAIFSKITIAGDYATGEIKTLSSSVIYPKRDEAAPISPVIDYFAETKELPGNLLIHTDYIPAVIARLGIAVIWAFFCLTAYSLSRGFAEQCSVLLTAEPLRVIRNGLLTYSLFLALTLVFALTVFFLPLALLFVLIFLILVISGYASLAILVGFTAASRVKKVFPTIAYAAGGLAILSVLTNIPIINFGVNMIFLPVLTSGLFITGLLNALINKKYYYVPYKTGVKPHKVDIEEVRKIILRKDKTQ